MGKSREPFEIMTLVNFEPPYCILSLINPLKATVTYKSTKKGITKQTSTLPYPIQNRKGNHNFDSTCFFSMFRKKKTLKFGYDLKKKFYTRK